MDPRQRRQQEARDKYLPNEELHNLHCSRNIIGIIKSRHVARKGGMRDTKFWS
jgi:hypothetical protein